MWIQVIGGFLKWTVIVDTAGNVNHGNDSCPWTQTLGKNQRFLPSGHLSTATIVVHDGLLSLVDSCRCYTVCRHGLIVIYFCCLFILSASLFGLSSKFRVCAENKKG